MADEDQVTSADQQKINQFSRLNQRSHEIAEELEMQRVRRLHLARVRTARPRNTRAAIAAPRRAFTHPH